MKYLILAFKIITRKISLRKTTHMKSGRTSRAREVKEICESQCSDTDVGRRRRVGVCRRRSALRPGLKLPAALLHTVFQNIFVLV